MATFVQDKSLSEENFSINQNEVEQGILKQLFYKVEHKKIPQSRYRKLHVKNFKNSFFKILIYSLFIALIMLIFFRNKCLFIWNSIESFVSNYNLPIISSFIVLFFLWLIALVFISCVWCLLPSTYHLKEITLSSDLKIESENSFSDSVFNKNLDEIMYFFEVTKYRIVFFEDLDRLNDISIFIHLRELNNLLNNDDSIKEKPIVFIYAVKDDIFTKEDRTKFFDFIIPVIPIINSTNSGEILLERLEESRKNGIIHNISQSFVLDVSPYISDMRMLQNIYNEFVVYKNTLQTSQELSLLDEQMMAIIIFKNLYPRDFADIQYERGIIKKAFENKISYIKNKKLSLQNEIDELSDIISKSKDDYINSVKELKATMLMGITGNIEFTIYFIDNYNNTIYADDIMNDSFDMYEFAKKDFKKIYYSNFRGQNKTYKDITNFKECINPYLKRLDYINTMEKEGLEELQNKIEDTKIKHHKLSGETLVDIILNYDDFVFEEEVSNNKLLVFLLRRGYIDENYANYINYFKGKSITTSDMNFILSIKNREAKDFDYRLTKTSMVIQRLQEYEFEQKEIYNFDLMEELLKNDDEQTKREILIKQLSDESEISWRFIDEFIDKTKYQEKFILLLSSKWCGLWQYISSLSILQYDRQLYYLSLLINILNVNDIEKLNINNSIKDYIENHSDIIQKLSILTSNEALCSVLAELKVSLGIHEFEGVQEYILDFIFDNNLYKLNEKMIFNVVLYKNSTMVDTLNTKPYTTIIDLGYNKIIDYINLNFEYYMKYNILVKHTLEDRQDIIIDMLLKILSNQNFCVELIKTEQFKVHDIKQFLEEEIENHKEDIKVIKYIVEQ